MKNLEVLSNGFNVAMLAEAFNCSVGRINELKNEIDVEWLAKEFNVDANELRNKIQNHVNINALAAFAKKHEINLDEIDFEAIAQNKKPKQTKVEYTVGMHIGQYEILNIEKIGSSNVFLVKDANGKVRMMSTKQIQEVERA